jgi:hypothetical protein
VDILWSDPLPGVRGFRPNTRGTGCFFGSEELDGFLDDNGLECLIRAHEWFDAGMDWPFGQQGRCLTVFSSSNYCGKGNRGAVALVSEDCAIDTIAFEPMGMEQMRRVLLPQWILAEGRPCPAVLGSPVLPEALIDAHPDPALEFVARL